MTWTLVGKRIPYYSMAMKKSIIPMRSRFKNMPITVYHAMGRPMSEGQTIIMGGDNVNGVCERVRCFEQIERGEQVSGAIAELIRADMDRWKR